MRLLQVVVEYLLLAAFAIARPLFVLQALGFGTAAVAAVLVAGGDWPGWLIRVAISGAALSATLLVTGLLLSIARQWEQAHTGAADNETSAWPMPFGATLLLVAGVAAYAASPMPALWSEIIGRLNGVVDWEGLSRPAPNAGIVILPLLIGLMVPALVTVAVFAAIVLPLALLILLPDRRPRFLALVGMSAVCQAGLALASWLAANAIAGLVDAADVVMRDSGDAEVLQVAGWLRQQSAVIGGIAIALLAPALGLVAWVFALHPWREPR